MTPDLQPLIHWIFNVAILFVAIGILTIALIQFAVDTLPLTRWFQRTHIENWLKVRAAAANLASAKSDLVHLATAGDAAAFYDLPIDQLCGKINASVQIILDYPDRHRDLFLCLSSDSTPRDVYTLNPPDPNKQVVRKILLRKPETELEFAEHNELDEYVAARNRVSHQIQRAIEALQISIGFRWKFWMRILQTIVSASLGVATLDAYNANFHPYLTPMGELGFIALTAILSVFLAPFASRLVASALEQIRA